MHVQRAQVSSDISGVTGLALLRARLAGARDPARCAACTDDRITARPHTLATSLEGHGREEWLLNRHPSRARSACDQQNIAACAPPIEAPLRTCDRQIEGSAPPLPTPTRRPKNARRHEPHVDLHTPRYCLRGVDLTRLDGLEVLTAHTRMAESGLAMSWWKSATPVASWRGFCPDHRLSGGTGLTRGTRDVVNRAADALRLGAPHAIPAMAHTRARLVYRRRTGGQHYVDTGMEHDEAQFRQQRLQWLQRQARELNLHLVPNQPVPSPVS